MYYEINGIVFIFILTSNDDNAMWYTVMVQGLSK